MARNDKDLANLAELVAVGHSIRDAAGELGISESLAYKVSATAEFKAKVHCLRTEKTEHISASALGAAEVAMRTLRELAQSAEKDSDRIKASVEILRTVVQFAEYAELRHRIDKLERASQESSEARSG